MTNDKDNNYGDFKGPFRWSLVIHIAIILLIVVGLPRLPKKELVLNTPIPVELVDIGAQTTANKPPVEAPKEKELEAPPKPVEKPPPAPKQVDDVKEKPKKPPPEKPKEKPKPKPAEKPKVSELPAPDKPKEEEEKKEEEAEEESADFNSLLKNLQETEQPTPDKPLEDVKEDAAPDASPDAPMSPTITMSELDALRQQLSGCWNVLAGANDAGDLAVDVRLTIGADRVVQQAEIIDMARYNSDGYFRAAADGAIRAVRNPKCTPLNLPPDKYDQWKVITIRFDPKDMF
ncbi:MAG: hypothetical protein GC136_09830 [Alphaproteobacteria bacterium]|nr:hypothetical protein [Alphaproteobacteria bacterium]